MNMHIIRPALLLLLAAISACSDRGSGGDINRELSDAQNLLAAGEYDKAYTAFERAANDSKNPLAQFTLALFHENGWGRPVDRARACQFYEQAAQQDIPAATEFLGHCLAEGIHRDVDHAEAARWYQRATELGLHYANCHLGELHIEGLGVEKDLALGVALCEKAAANNSVPAMLTLGRLFLEHDELRNAQTALNWYASAAEYNSAEAQHQLGVMLRDGTGIAQDTVVAQQWFEAAAGQGYQPAYFENARLLFDAPRNPETGLWYEEDLARAYLLLTASLRTSDDENITQQSQHMLEHVLEVMPQSWAGDLDAKVDAHLEQHKQGTEAPPAT